MSLSTTGSDLDIDKPGSNQTGSNQTGSNQMDTDNEFDPGAAGGVQVRMQKETRELAQYVRDLYASGARMWTKEMFLDAEAELAKQPMPHAIMIRSMNGALRRKQVPTTDALPHRADTDLRQRNNGRISTRFKIYQEMVWAAEEGSFERDPDEVTGQYPAESDVDDKQKLATRALTLCVASETFKSIEYVQLKDTWDDARRNWTRSGVCNELAVILGSTACIPRGLKKIVCFGLGNLDESANPSLQDAPYTSDRLPHRRAMTQHAAALTMAAVLGGRLGTGPLPVLAQNPAYSPMAKRLLADEGIEVVGGHGSLAFTHVDDDTLVFSCNPNIPVKQVVADIARPAAMIWNRVTPAAEEKTEWGTTVIFGQTVPVSPWRTDQDSPRTRKLVEDYHRYDFPKPHDGFGGLEIYLRKD